MLKEITGKAVKTARQLKFIKVFFELVGNPNDTPAVFRLQEALLGMASPEQVENGFAQIMANKDSIRQAVQSRYLAPNYKIDDLKNYAPGTLGYAYYRHMHDNGFTPDFFPPVKPDSDRHYFELRMRQTHDIWHVVTGFGPSVEDEIGLQAFYSGQFTAPFSVLLTAVGLLHSVMVNQKLARPIMDGVKQGYEAGSQAKPFHAVQWEEMWERPLADVRRELNVQPFSARYDFAPAEATLATSAA